MKTLNKITILTLIAAGLFSAAAKADELVPVQIQNPHGQSIVLFRSNEQTVALFAGGKGVGTNAKAEKAAAKPVYHRTSHGETHVLYR